MPGYPATLAALSVGQIVSWAALYYAFTSFVLPMQSELGWSRPTLMGAYTLGLAVWGLAAYGAGAAIDRGHGRAAMSWGAVLAAAGFVAWSVAGAPWMLYGAWTLLGGAMALLLYEPAFNVMAKREPQRLRHAITVLTLVGGFASTLAFPAVAALMNALGWRHALLALAAAMLLVAPLHAWALRGPASAPDAPRHDPARAAVPDAGVREALRSRIFQLLALAFTLYSFAQAALWAHVMPALVDKGLREGEALAVLVWIGPAQVAGRFFYLWAGRWWSLHAMGAVVMTGLPVALVLFALGHSVPVLLVSALCFGFANGQVTILRGAIVPATFGRANVGRISGAMTAVAVLARAAAPLAAAWLLLALGGYRPTVLLLAVLGALSVVAFALHRR
jgi:MFS family permease